MLTDTQKAARLTALTSSDAWKLLHPELWPELAADLAAGRPEKEQTAAMKRGEEHEDAICRAAAAMMGLECFPCDTARHHTCEYVIAHPDRQLLDPKRQFDPGVLEAKNPGGEFVAGRELEKWHCQLAWHLLATGYTWGALAVGYGDWTAGPLNLKVFPVVRNDRHMDSLLALAHEFWAVKETLCKASQSESWQKL